MFSRGYYSSLTDSDLTVHSSWQCAIWLAHKPHCWERNRWGLKLHCSLAGGDAVSRQRCKVSLCRGRYVLLCGSDIQPTEGNRQQGRGEKTLKWDNGFIDGTVLQLNGLEGLVDLVMSLHLLEKHNCSCFPSFLRQQSSLIKKIVKLWVEFIHKNYILRAFIVLDLKM